MSTENITIHLLICHDLSVESPGLHTLGELLGGLLELGQDVVDTGVVTCAQAIDQMGQNVNKEMIHRFRNHGEGPY